MGNFPGMMENFPRIEECCTGTCTRPDTGSHTNPPSRTRTPAPTLTFTTPLTLNLTLILSLAPTLSLVQIPFKRGQKYFAQCAYV